MKDYFKILRRFVYSLELILSYAIQRIPDSLIFFLTGVRPVYLIALVLVISIIEGEKAGFIFSIIAGIIIDLDYSYCLGLYTIILPISAIILATLFKKNLNYNFLSANILISIFILIIYSIEFFLFSTLTKHSELTFEFFNFQIKKIFYTCTSVPIFYLFNRTINIFFRKKSFGSSDGKKE